MIIISPFSKKLRDTKRNPKNYPYWDKLISGLEKNNAIVQVGVPGENKLVSDFRIGLSFKELKKMINDCDFWISVDNFFPHLAHHLKVPGVVLWGISDPNIFGYPENLNILKDRKYLRPNQFDIWEDCKYNEEAFVKPEVIINELNLLNYEQILKREG